MDKTALDSNPSLHWHLREPILKGARLEIPWPPGSLIRCGVVTVKTFVQLTGGNIADTMALAAKLEIHSIRIAEQLLASLRNTVLEEEHNLLKDWSNGLKIPDQNDPFPRLAVKAKLTVSEELSPLLEVGSKEWMALDCIKGKTLYKVCVKAVNKGKLKTRKDTPWREHFRVKGETKPAWGMQRRCIPLGIPGNCLGPRATTRGPPRAPPPVCVCVCGN